MPETIQTRKTPTPRYTEKDETGFSACLKAFQDSYPDYPIVPVTRHPSAAAGPGDTRRGISSTSTSTQPWQRSASSAARDLQADIAAALFASIAGGDTAAAARLISQGLISPDCPSAGGETPLLASIRARSAPTARALLALGADPSLFGKTSAGAAAAAAHAGPLPPGAEDRTPLMLAAATGQLAVVRLLLEGFSADDAAVGPGGETALRLAAGAGHRDVVRYLPARRRGGWRRLRHSREAAALRRAAGAAGKAARLLAWEVPRLLAWDVPCAVWRRRRRVAEWLVRLARAVPGALGVLARGVWGGVKGVPRLVWGLVVWVSEAVPRAWCVFRKGLVDGAKRVGHAVAFAARRLVSVLHSFLAAVVTRLKDIKLRDVGHDLLVAMEALFVRLPRAVLAFMSQSVAAVGRAIKACFSNYYVRTLLKLLCYVPRIFWSMLESLWASCGRGLDELITLVNPKRIPSGAVSS